MRAVINFFLTFCCRKNRIVGYNSAFISGLVDEVYYKLWIIMAYENKVKRKEDIFYQDIVGKFSLYISFIFISVLY